VKIIHVREISNVAATLVDGLRRLGHEAELRPMRTHRAEAAPLSRALNLPSRLGEAVATSRYVRRGRFDIVHIHWAYMGWLGILGRYPYLLHCHGSDLRRNLRWPLLGWATRRSLRSARRVFYSTPDLKGLATAARPDAAFIPNPIDLSRFRPAQAANGRAVRVLLMSRFEAVKSPETAVAMTRELKRREPAVEVDAFDWGVDTSRFADPSLLNLIPTVPYSAMPELLGRYDIVVGQFGLGIVSMSELEAMACGKPVVGWYDYPEVYDEPPPLLSTRDVAQGAEMLARLAADSALRKQSGQRGRAWVEEHHDSTKVARLLERHYREVLEG
jgi:glycosyltransferase involved in cell wall biosynthesis